MVNKLYEQFKDKGFDTTWYEKSRGQRPDSKAPIQLTDDHCGLLSIYFLNKMGRLFTTTSAGVPYNQVRVTGKKIAKDIYICLGCKAQFKNYEEATKHYE